MFINKFKTTKKIFIFIAIILSITFLILFNLKNIRVISFASITNEIKIKFLNLNRIKVKIKMNGIIR